MHIKGKKNPVVTKQEQKVGVGRGPFTKPAAFERVGSFLLRAEQARVAGLSLQNPPNSFSQYPT